MDGETATLSETMDAVEEVRPGHVAEIDVIRALSVVREVKRAGGHATLMELDRRAHELDAIKNAIWFGWLRAYRVHAPWPYHFALTDEGDARS